MKIYFFTSKLNFRTSGGSIEEFDLMMRTLQKRGHEVVAVTLFSRANDIPEARPYRIIEEHVARADLLGISWGVYRLLKKHAHDADFFHVDGHLCLYGAGLYRRLGGRVPVSAFFNRELGSFPADRSFLIGETREPLVKKARRYLRSLLERTIGMYLARAIDVRSFISPMYQAMYERFGLRANEHTMVLGDPIDLKGLMRENGVTQRSYRDRIQKQGPVRLFFSSRMAPAKGFDLILAGFARVSNKERFRLILGGDGPEEAAIKRLADELGVREYVEFPGWMSREQLYARYKEADVYIQVGWRPEGTSISLLYAMAFGLPSIVPRDTGLAWQAGDSALTVENGNHDELARAIERLGEDAALREKLSAACYGRMFSDELDHEKVIGAWAAMMEAVRAAQVRAS